MTVHSPFQHIFLARGGDIDDKLASVLDNFSPDPIKIHKKLASCLTYTHLERI
jgi:hypothetical protein